MRFKHYIKHPFYLRIKRVCAFATSNIQKNSEKSPKSRNKINKKARQKLGNKLRNKVWPTGDWTSLTSWESGILPTELQNDLNKNRIRNKLKKKFRFFEIPWQTWKKNISSWSVTNFGKKCAPARLHEISKLRNNKLGRFTPS